MSPHAMFSWLAMSKNSFDLYKQLAQQGQVGLLDAAARIPAEQAQLATIMKAALDLGRQWTQLHDNALTSMLQAQLATSAFQQQGTILQNFLELQQSLAADLAQQQYGAFKLASERSSACISDLRKVQSKEELTIVVAEYAQDASAQLRASAAQTGGLLNSANAALNVLVNKALDAMAEQEARS
ncbi:hypothetical protein [Massilia sp. CF038]|uniref:hypothetical protein n=1 Tax=Massilia sp. CF038 TaxID=1881045 RepID=UPI0009103664|nr:hypothetical protein [Massilia sp. CF038]SHG48632.1 hypothetical protein SAMN05428948_0686 [Massilia sp. CF038]